MAVLGLCAAASLGVSPSNSGASDAAKQQGHLSALASCAACPPPQPSGRACSRITAPAGAAGLLEPYRWTVHVHRVGCKVARRIARRYLRANDPTPRRGWSCDRDTSGVSCIKHRSRRRGSITVQPKHPIGRACGKVALEPIPTDHLASDVRAINIGCRAARVVARDTSLSGRSLSGWRCTIREYVPASGPHYAHWVCRKAAGKLRVRWLEY